MATRYHVNPETGRANICNAKFKCDFAIDGVEPPHYATKDEAKAGYEKEASQEFGNISSLKKEKNFTINPEQYNYLHEPSKIKKLSSKKLSLMLENLQAGMGQGWYDSSVQAVVDNPNAKKEHFEYIANNLRAGDFYKTAQNTDSELLIEATLNSSRAHNRNMMFDNPNVSDDDLYNMTKKFSDAKYSKIRINYLSSKGYDMSHLTNSKPKKAKSTPLATPKRNKQADAIRRGTLKIKQSTIDEVHKLEVQNNSPRRRDETTEYSVNETIKNKGGMDAFIQDYGKYERTQGSGILSVSQGSYKTSYTEDGDEIRFQSTSGNKVEFTVNGKRFQSEKSILNGKWMYPQEMD